MDINVNLKVLFIDDDKATNFLNKHIAKNSDKISSIDLVASGSEGILYLKKCLHNDDDKPHLIFLDINMPAMNGWEFLKQFYVLEESLRNEIKVVILSSSDDPKDLNNFENDHNLLDFIRKPLNKDSFDSIIKKVIK